MLYRSQPKASLFLGASFFVLAASAAPVMAQETAQAETESVIVTGTRVTGMTAADSAAPITVLGSDALTHVGQPNLIQSLSQTLPSFEAEGRGGDTGQLTLSARLRGISPNDTLVLVNGKRRHSTANLHVLAGAFQGAATTDLDLIPTNAIDHIEVLEDGAAAQYGTDAIAGVVNIILKHNNTGGMFEATGGQYYQGDGNTYDFSGNIGFDLDGKGFLTISGEKRFKGFSTRGGSDPRVADINGNVLPGLPYNAAAIPGFPRPGYGDGDPESQLTTVFYNSEYDILPNLTLYSFGSYGRRIAKAWEGYRTPNQAGFTALQSSNQQYLAPGSANPGCGTGITPASGLNACYQTNPSGSYTTPGEIIFSTVGFKPQETLAEDDFSYTFGGRGEIEGWNWDLSGTYGKDIDRIGTANSVNTSLFVDTHTTPLNFYDGAFVASELTGNLDVTKNFNVGLATPLSIAAGFEGRENTYAINPGDPASYYKVGAASFPGYGPVSVLAHSRKNYAEYVDFAVSPIEDLQIDIAGRHEYYTDFGDAKVGKITARYDLSPAFAVRGTLATGFRAPTLPEEYYTQTNVAPTSATVTLGPNSPGARAEGITPLGPESSVNYSIGFVAHLWDNFSATVDGYSIAIGNRIVGTGTAPCKSNGVIVSTVVCNALTANGNVLDPGVVSTGTSVFVNGVSTLTHGVDITANYNSDFEDWGTVNWTAAANWGETSISRTAPNPAALAGITLQTPISIANLTSLAPKFKFILGGLWNLDAWTINLKEEIYGPTVGYTTPGSGGTAAFPVFFVVNGANYYQIKTPTAGITDLDISYAFTEHVSFTVGASNLFDQRPPVMPLQTSGQPLDSGTQFSQPFSQSPYGIDGGFYFGRVSFNW
jgi:iron complex outermembrane receptor protein